MSFLKRPARLRRPNKSSTARQTPAQRAAERRRIRIYIALLALFSIILFVNDYLVSRVVPDQPPRLTLPYSAFKDEATQGKVAEIVSRGDIIQGTFREPVTYPPGSGRQSLQFSTVRPDFAGPGLETLLEEQGVVINAHSLDEPRSWWLNLLLAFGPTVLFLGVIVWAIRMTAGKRGILGMGRSRARRYDDTQDSIVSFEHVAGVDEAKAELVEVVDFLKDRSRYTRLGGSVPKGALLIGPPGTGKTLLARAVAGEAGVPFFSMGASEFVEMVVGVGASRVRDLFRQARKAAPAIVFIDELDAVGRARGGPTNIGGSDEREQTLNQILTEMDGFDPGEGVIVIAATNRPDVLDPALLRAGRFDRRVVVPAPDKRGRVAILRVHTRKVPLARDVVLSQIAAATPGLVGADLKNLVNEAALLAARHGREVVRQRDFMDALEKLMLGPARQLLLSPEERTRIAYHEAGHAILGLVVPGADPVHRVTITPRGQALGVTYQRPEEDRHNYDEVYLRAVITGALGGRAAEEMVYGSRTTGAENDLDRATDLARRMVTRWGMSTRFGPMSLASSEGAVGIGLPASALSSAAQLSEATAQAIDAEVKSILEECYLQAQSLLRRYRNPLELLVQALLEHETLDQRKILDVTGLGPAARLLDSAGQPHRVAEIGAASPTPQARPSGLAS
jgi:cell division protease FtsH